MHRKSVSKISVLFASDSPILPSSVMNLLDNTDIVKVVAFAEMQEDVLPLVEVHRPHLVVLDLEVAGMRFTIWHAVCCVARSQHYL